MILERMMDQQEEAEKAEEEELAGIGGFTRKSRVKGRCDDLQLSESPLSLLPPVQIHFGFQVDPKINRSNCRRNSPRTMFAFCQRFKYSSGVASAISGSPSTPGSTVQPK